MSDRDSADDEIDDSNREDPDESDMDDPEGPPLVECYHCHKMIHEESEWCHHCGNYVSKEESRPVPKWIMIGTMLGILGLLGGVIAWLFS